MSQEAQIDLGGKMFTIRKMGSRIGLDVRQEIRRRRDNPLEVVLPIIKEVSEEQGQMLLREAYQDAIRNRQVNPEDVLEFAASPEGQIYMLYLMIRECRTDISLDAVRELWDKTEAPQRKLIDDTINRLNEDDPPPVA